MGTVTKTMVVLLVAFGIGCQASSRKAVNPDLTEFEALELAVDLANKECDAKYSAKPFDLSSYSIVFDDGRWRWGALDQRGADGFSAMVSFGARGENRKVEVFFSTDRIIPETRIDDQRD